MHFCNRSVDYCVISRPCHKTSFVLKCLCVFWLCICAVLSANQGPVRFFCYNLQNKDELSVHFCITAVFKIGMQGDKNNIFFASLMAIFRVAVLLFIKPKLQ